MLNIHGLTGKVLYHLLYSTICFNLRNIIVYCKIIRNIVYIYAMNFKWYSFIIWGWENYHNCTQCSQLFLIDTDFTDHFIWDLDPQILIIITVLTDQWTQYVQFFQYQFRLATANTKYTFTDIYGFVISSFASFLNIHSYTTYTVILVQAISIDANYIDMAMLFLVTITI